jgi:hypothetical protein
MIREDAIADTFRGIGTIPRSGSFNLSVLRAFVLSQTFTKPESGNATNETILRAESATRHADRGGGVADSIDSLLNSCDDEILDQGIESSAAKTLQVLVQLHTDDIITEIACRLAGKPRNALIFQEVLSWLGQIDHQTTRSHRRWLLEKALSNESETIRYGAIMGLSYLDAFESLIAVRKARQVETNPHLRRLVESLEAQLEETKASNGFALQGD